MRLGTVQLGTSRAQIHRRPTQGRLNCCCLLLAAAGAASPAAAQFADSCSSAPTVGEGVFSFDLTAATSGSNPFTPDCAETRAALIDQWVQYVPTGSGPIEISTIGFSSGDTVLSVHDTPFGGTTDCDFAPFLIQGCNDDSGGTAQSRVVLNAVAGQALLIRVAGALQTRPTGSVSISPYTPPPGDSCTSPLAAVDGVNTYDATAAVLNGFISCRGFRDLYFTYTPAASGALTVSVCGQPSQADISIFAACDGAILGCTDYAGCSVGTAVEAGFPLLIRIANDTATGPEQFTITLDPGAFPSNDTCDAASTAVLGDNPFDNTFATTQIIPACGGGIFPFTAGLDVWFEFVPPVTGNYDISTERSLGLSDTQVAVSASCFEPPFACNDDARGFLSFVRTPLTAGQSYRIAVTGNGLPNAGTPIDRGEGVLSIRQSVPPNNDACDTALNISAGTTAYDVYDATTGGQEASCVLPGQVTSNDIWFRYVPSVNGPVEARLSPDGAAGSLSVFYSCEAPVAADSAGFLLDPTLGGFSARLVVDGQAGTPLLFRVAYSMFSNDPMLPRGDGEIYVGPPLAPVPTNDSCVNAAPLSPGVTSIDLTNSAKDCSPNSSPATDSCAGVTDNDIFFSYTAPAGGPVSILILDGVPYPQFDGLVVSVYDGCGAAPIACSFIFGNAPLDIVQWEALAGSTYIVRVGSVLSNGSLGILTGAIALTEGAACVADFDDGSGTGLRDGGVGIEDLLYYLGIYDLGSFLADVDDGSSTGTLDGGVGIEDLLYYLQRYDQGC